MGFTGFAPAQFEALTKEGLESRMKAIQESIQPKFRQIGETLSGDIALMAGREMFVHIAKHARRTVNPPVDTWMAVCANKRGYKQVPHFQIGLFDDRLFLWLAFIYELPSKQAVADQMLRTIDEVASLIPPDYSLSFDHMKKDSVTAGELGKEGLIRALERFRDVKKAELLIGRVIQPDDPVLTDGAAFLYLAEETFRQLMPLYLNAADIHY